MLLNDDVRSEHILICSIISNLVMEDSVEYSGVAMLKSYFNHKSGAVDIMVCRLCRKDTKAAKGKR